MDKIVSWKKTIEIKVVGLEKDIAALNKQFESLHKALFERMETYDENVSRVGTNLKAMDDVFKKTLPSLTQNVNDLSRITSTMKSAKKKVKV